MDFWGQGMLEERQAADGLPVCLAGMPRSDLASHKGYQQGPKMQGAGGLSGCVTEVHRPGSWLPPPARHLSWSLAVRIRMRGWESAAMEPRHGQLPALGRTSAAVHLLVVLTCHTEALEKLSLGGSHGMWYACSMAWKSYDLTFWH